ncbi:hypothetical protein BGZ95_003462 [Linnemannia exigua]|uniref:Uncharacterized protein n=1 Tax=Linnemannia exigua TaxID=604196 RepID=A0AAD4H2Q5_9FUNG|nr:hypothetical protein BGZ95_003462 [Linnemannia exigua]
MLCLPALNQSEFSGSPMAAAAAASIRAQHCGYLTSASTSTPAPAPAATYNNNSYNSTPSSSSLYSLPLPPQPQNLDSFSLPSSSTPCSMPGAPSWQAQAAAPNSSNTIAPLTNTTTPKQPLILDSLTANKISIVENLVDTAALIIESIWPSPVGATCSSKTPVIPLHIFVKETLRRSRTTLSTLQLALYYIYKIRNQVLAAQEKIRQDHLHQQHQHRQRQLQPLSPNGSFDNFSDEEGRQQRDYFHSISAAHAKAHIQKNSLPLTPPVANHTPTALSPLSLSSSTSTSPILAKSEPVGCGRRMFLAALILASKFQQDRTYSNKAWSKISGLPVAEINLNEITFLTLIDYRLFVSQAVFQKWVTILTEKGKVRDRAASARTSNTFSSDVAVQQPTRRNSIQYCNNTLPARMTCVTASSLEHQHQQQQTPSATVAPHLPSFALFVAEQQRSLQSTPTCEKPSFQFEMAIPLGAPVLSKQALDAHSSATGISGLVQPESAPRQQQGMGASMTLRWVQDQRREFIRSRLRSMGYTVAQQQQQQPSESPSQIHLAQRSILENFQNNVIVYSETGTYSLNMHRQQQQEMKVDTKVGRDQTFLPSPTSSGSPSQLTGSKRRMTDSDESDEMKDQRSNARRRLSVSFLVDCQ